MSTTLPEDAPTNDQAAPSVEEPAPEVDGAVAEDSVGSGEEPKTVPAERFNGLMSKFNQTQSELEATRQSLAELEARLDAQQTSEGEQSEVSDTDTSSLEARVNELSQMLIQERLESARSQALNDYPEAAPFADLIVADTPDDVREMARLIAERAKTATPGTTTTEDTEETPLSSEGEATTEPEGEVTTEGEGEAVTEPPVAGGGAAFSTEASTDDRVVDAIQKGSFADFVNAKWENTSLGADSQVG